jgi:hypothetical protein
MSSTVKLESESDTEFDPLSTQNESELLDVKREEFVLPVAVTASEVSLASCLTLSWLSEMKHWVILGCVLSECHEIFYC